MGIGDRVTSFYAYPTRVVHLEEIEVPTAHLKSPTAAQQAKVTTRVGVSLAGNRITTEQALRQPVQHQPIFLFHEQQAANLRTLVEARRRSFHNILGYANRAGSQVAKGTGAGVILGVAAGAALAYVVPPLGIKVLVGAAFGGVSGGTVGSAAGAFDAWKSECATIRVIDYIINFNEMFTDYSAGRIDLEEATKQLLQLYNAIDHIGPAGNLLFNEGYGLIEISPSPRLKQLTQEFIRRRDTA